MTDPNATAFVPTAAGHPMLANLDPVRLAPPIFVGDIGECGGSGFLDSGIS
jgi:hypothetical protein